MRLETGGNPLRRTRRFTDTRLRVFRKHARNAASDPMRGYHLTIPHDAMKDIDLRKLRAGIVPLTIERIVLLPSIPFTLF